MKSQLLDHQVAGQLGLIYWEQLCLKRKITWIGDMMEETMVHKNTSVLQMRVGWGNRRV